MRRRGMGWMRLHYDVRQVEVSQRRPVRANFCFVAFACCVVAPGGTVAPKCL